MTASLDQVAQHMQPPTPNAEVPLTTDETTPFEYTLHCGVSVAAVCFPRRTSVAGRVSSKWYPR